MSGSAFAVTHHAFSSGAGRTSDGNGSHASTLKSPSYTKSVSWQHYLSLREKTISGAKWSAIATVIIIGLGLVQMTVLAQIIDNHQFGLLTVSLVIIALADTLSDFGIANSIIQRKEISHLELTTLYWLNVGLGIVVCVAVFLLSDLIGDVLNNPDLAPLIKTLSLAFVVIPHGQQFRALMQKELEFNKIGMIETSAVLAGFTFTVVSAHFWPLAMTAILGYLVNMR